VGLTVVSHNGLTTTFTHPQNENPPDDVTGFYQWSQNLNDWYAGDDVDGPLDGPTVALVPNTVGTTTTVTATASEAMDSLFLRAGLFGPDLLSAIRAGRSRKVVTIGTSLTGNSAWPGQMATWLKSEAPDPNNVTVVNLGIGASNSESGGINILADIKAQNPDTVFMEFSINDAYGGMSLQQSEDNHNFIIDQLQAYNPSIEIIIQTMNNPIGASLTARPDIESFYQVARDVAAARGLLLIDHYPNWLSLYNSDPTTWLSYMPDGLHPNATGTQNVMIPEMKQALEAAAP
jgi:acyl-CoA thioesterase-1